MRNVADFWLQKVTQMPTARRAIADGATGREELVRSAGAIGGDRNLLYDALENEAIEVADFREREEVPHVVRRDIRVQRNLERARFGFDIRTQR